MTPHATTYEFSSIDGSALPAWTAGAHLDMVVVPEFLRQDSMSGDPSDRTRYQIAVLREDGGRGGSKMLHRIFAKGRRIFTSIPINHFQLVEDASKTFLMGGGIGVTPMIAFAHRLHAIGTDFEFHYSAHSRSSSGFLTDLETFRWSDRVQLHFSDEEARPPLGLLLQSYRPGWRVDTCAPDRYMGSVMAAARKAGFPDEARHLEYFLAPERPAYINDAFTLRLTRSGREFAVPADKSATDVLAENGIHVDVKCSDGICGGCKCGPVSGEVEHRDFVLSKRQREGAVILCQSCTAEEGGVIEVDL